MLISSNLLVFIRYRVQVKGCPRVGDMQKDRDVAHAPKLLIFSLVISRELGFLPMSSGLKVRCHDSPEENTQSMVSTSH